MTPAPFLSVCMIVKNEAEDLGRALASVAPLGADVVVVDTGSTDATVAIAERHGARVFHFAWIDDFSAARNVALAHARGAWILVLDADEEVTDALRANVVEALRSTDAGGVRVPVDAVDAAGRLQQRMSSTRFVRNGRGYAYQNRVHEDIEVPILEAGGALAFAALPIVHRGYTAERSRAKGRSDRNLRLVRASHAEAPDEPRHWHYLGLELAVAGRIAEAATWLDRVVARAPEHVLAGWSASQLASIRASERAFGAAWDAAALGARARLGRIASLFTLGRLALRERDEATASACADALLVAPDRAEGDVARRVARAAILGAEATALRDPKRAAKTLAALVRDDPDDALAGDALVRVVERLGERTTAAARALDLAPSRSVLAGGVAAFVRARAFGAAVALAEKFDVRNEAYAWALAHVGRQADAYAALASFGEDASAHVVAMGIARREPDMVARGLDLSPPAWAAAAERLLAGRKAAREDEALVGAWLALAVAHRADDLAVKLANAMPLSEHAARARHAVLLFESGEPMRALGLALEASAEPDAREVIGLVALDRGDHAAAAAMLALRVSDGDAPVHVVTGACASLARLGRRSEARAVLEAGRASRPASRALAALGV